jgi:predicted O-methyltransferase YrrM
MKKFVGDLSREDAELLERYASTARRVLEFGVGGSTQIIAQSVPAGATFVSLDTDPAWIAVTRDRLGKLGVADRCRFLPHDEAWLPAVTAASPSFDLIFDDGVDHLRRPFALESWPLLEPGGFMLFHDTRRFGDVVNVAWVMQTYFTEVEDVYVNQRVGGVASNVSIIKKKVAEPYVNWNQSEDKPLWMYGGFGPIPEEFWGAGPGGPRRG